MTKGQAKALAARIERLWGGKPIVLEHHYMHVWCPELIRSLEENVQFKCRQRADTGALQYLIEVWLDDEWELVMCYSQDGGRLISVTNDESPLWNVTQCWLPIFRRNCWLSGCAIEASAHEKAEWMQGFSQEELEAWNLKM